MFGAHQRRFSVVVALACFALLAGCGGSDEGSTEDGDAAGTTATTLDGTAPVDRTTDGDSGDDRSADGTMPDPEALCSAVDTVPIAQVLGGEPDEQVPLASSATIDCLWKRTTGGPATEISVRFLIAPNFHDSVTESQLAVYSPVQIPGLDDAYSAFAYSVTVEAANGWGVEVLPIAETPDDEQLAAIAQAGIAAADEF